MERKVTKDAMENMSKRIGQVLNDPPALTKVLSEDPETVAAILYEHRATFGRVLSFAATEVLGGKTLEPEVLQSLAGGLASNPRLLQRLLSGTGA
jgi:predicted Kef-type K+ transport protein